MKSENFFQRFSKILRLSYPNLNAEKMVIGNTEAREKFQIALS